MTEYFIQAFIYLSAAVIAVPIAQRMGLGSVLGYLIAGVIIGPIVGLVGSETNTIQHFAEFGVVMMLFLVGLELEPKMLWSMRNRLLGMGGLQVGLSTGIVMAIALMFEFQWTVALTIGLIFSLSSTAIVLQTLNEKGLTKTTAGKNAFSVLLFQDIAVIPMLALIPLLALPELVEAAQSSVAAAAEHHDELSLVANLPGGLYALVLVLSIGLVVFGGHYLSRPVFRFIADSGVREISTAAALLLVIGIATLMSLVGVSPALGTFLAGVVLANSEFKHELETHIGPFKGLLLGLFFITVGAGIDFEILWQYLGVILGATAAVMIVKGLVLLLLSFIFRIKGSDRWLYTLSLAQAGEFGFVLLSFSQQNHVISAEVAQPLSIVVALSMFLTPGLFIFYEKVILPKYQQTSNDREQDQVDEQGTVIIAGIGRFGQIVNRLLLSNGVKTVVLDHQATQVDNLRKVNTKAFYGDATRPDLLETAGVATASAFVVAIDNPQASVELVKHLKHKYPKLKVISRAFDRGHGHLLRQAGADYVESETFRSALKVGAESMKAMGFSDELVQRQKKTYMRVESEASEVLYNEWANRSDGEKFGGDFINLFIEYEERLKEAIVADTEAYKSQRFAQEHPCDPDKENCGKINSNDTDKDSETKLMS
ncbi:monovalent cation:proton antiporter-2 (CPA2) family protein [Shewanella sp. 1_MG-2023]|uniref:Monovalent cation:proton antiporter-2 (CPA2) family protein n=1 Tax=Shewanella electrodiphila TaxID=934143 RepID=A0ABT0KNS5_9GAMM|nr:MULTISPECIES: monovalent cation:proton antiporter-2 (CPA2) family protein [Shewanella]MCL1045191.1 monovalent cation:proton antiporter-2 (CPA2) family protein [Shewanella electrodiphila]MDO6611833.1 monovalent cation:proton antiporter-2 (CPA2) family protein [Shewanella sp. 7_MG-2023]MDO6771688.1 monovalent cation:proton antiporter-2 (CPA2) family protein [Shewanella sp. 2_MG-2023]MDO6793914.1 monovalent cation:proton antiporter-2 (CPA2) family protein [Shewanella sp. 1_MG-2023]